MEDQDEAKFTMPPQMGLEAYLNKGGSITLYQQDINNGDKCYIVLEPAQAQTLIGWLELLLAEFEDSGGEG